MPLDFCLDSRIGATYRAPKLYWMSFYPWPSLTKITKIVTNLSWVLTLHVTMLSSVHLFGYFLSYPHQGGMITPILSLRKLPESIT